MPVCANAKWLNEKTLLYVSESKIRNLYDENLLKKGQPHFIFSETEIKLKFISGKVSREEENSLATLHKILQHKKVKKLQKENKECNLQTGLIYECDGTMHWQKERPTNIGTIITHNFYTNPNSVLTFEIDIDNTSFNSLTLACSMKNFAFMEFVDKEKLRPNSLGELLISATKSIGVHIIFELIDIDYNQKDLIGAPIVICSN